MSRSPKNRRNNGKALSDMGLPRELRKKFADGNLMSGFVRPNYSSNPNSRSRNYPDDGYYW